MVNRKIIWSANARLQLLNILEFYYERNQTATYSKKLYKKIQSVLRLISTQNFIGKITDRKDVRVVSFWEFQIFYKVAESQLEILTVWDCRQNPLKINY
jgi:toxin YoeB